MLRLWDKFKEHPIVYLMIFALAFIGIPFIVYGLSEFHKLPVGGTNDWAGFWGGYLGALIGAMATIIAVTLEIRNSRRQAKEDEEKRIRPYLHLEPIGWNNYANNEIEFQGKLHNIGLHAVCNISLYENNQDTEPRLLWTSKGVIPTNSCMQIGGEKDKTVLNLNKSEFYYFSFFDIEGNYYSQDISAECEMKSTYKVPIRFISREPIKIDSTLPCM